MATATLIKDISAEFVGTAKFWKLNSPAQQGERSIEFVVTSAIPAREGFWGDGHPETMVFEADAVGSILDWGELAVAWDESHEDAIADLGYEVAS